jgi:hypothetical protein
MDRVNRISEKARWQRVTPLLCALFCFLLPTFATAQYALTFLPSSPLFPSLRADGIEHQLSLSKIAENREWIGVIGGTVPAARYQDSSTVFQAGIAASVFTGLMKTPGHIYVLTLDYRVDFPLELMCAAGLFQFGYGHVSSHFADDGLSVLNVPRRHVVKDYLRTALARTEGLLGGTVYAVAQWNYHALPVSDKHWMIQLGINSLDFPICNGVGIYAAADIKWREEVSWGTTQSLQLGVALSGVSTRSVRFALTFRSGYDERGQFYDMRNTLTLLSIGVGW